MRRECELCCIVLLQTVLPVQLFILFARGHTCWKQSTELAYFTAWPEVIIILLRTVSMGYEARPAPMVMPQPSRKLARKLSCKRHVTGKEQQQNQRRWQE